MEDAELNTETPSEIFKFLFVKQAIRNSGNL